ncbi:nurim [Anaeramoeba flamelloides]|uniref:Nuclear envelope membrane protein n=1 Tax=Anaeramoeba flamelloides TaxID=1746091 RepID=A0AAV7ZJS9_9EUKA|nr:nurim [Anaeramoeba flamelloides]
MKRSSVILMLFLGINLGLGLITCSVLHEFFKPTIHSDKVGIFIPTIIFSNVRFAFLWDIAIIFMFFVYQMVLYTRIKTFLISKASFQFVGVVLGCMTLIPFLMLPSFWIHLDYNVIWTITNFQLLIKVVSSIGWLLTIAQLFLYSLLHVFGGDTHHKNRDPMKNSLLQVLSLLDEGRTPNFLGPIFILFATPIMTADRLLLAMSTIIWLILFVNPQSQHITSASHVVRSSISFLWSSANPYNLYTKGLNKNNH